MSDATYPPAPLSGRIDVHSHLLPGIDDGCSDETESFECIRRLKAMGYVGTVCTPHMYEEMYPQNTPSNIREMVLSFQKTIQRAGLDYRIWPGGEVRLTPGVVDWFEIAGVPTLANSRCVLLDFWETKWPGWLNPVFEWLIHRGYQPILAHPERGAGAGRIDKHLRDIEAMGVWLQGNFRCMTGEEGYQADRLVRQLIAENRYQLMALDMHGPDSLASRFDGLMLVEGEFGDAAVERYTVQEPRARLGL